MHWSFPYPIDEVVKIPITEIQKISSNIGWYFTTPEQELSGEELPAGPSLNPAMDGYVITADRNIIHTRATLYYHIEDPIRYVFDFASASNTVQNALNNALLYTAAHFKVDDMLYSDVAGFQEAVQQRVADLAEQEQLGIAVEQCSVESIPPRQLKDVFDQVTTARQNQNKVLDDAHSYENQVINSAERAGLNHHQPGPERTHATSSPSRPTRKPLAPCCRITRSIPVCSDSRNWCRRWDRC